MARPEDKLKTGLTDKEIAEKIAAGAVNGDLKVNTRSYRQIVTDNLLSLFNLINVILLAGIIVSGSMKNALFFLVVIWNTAIGIFQEIRAKKTIEKLSLISAPEAQVIRNGKCIKINSEDIVLGEIMRLHSGDQILSDCLVRKGSCFVDESLITGECENVQKNVGDMLLSGSFVSRGSVIAEAVHTGADNYVSQITGEVGAIKRKDSVIMKSVRTIVRIIAVSIIPVAGLFVWRNFFLLDLDFSDAMVKTAAAISAMIPGGLVLLVSVVLAVSAVRLAAHNTLAQDLYSVEYLARVDTLLLDKTGTITKGNLCTEDILPLKEHFREKDIKDLLRFYMDHMDDNSPTLTAIRSFLQDPNSSPCAGAEGEADDMGVLSVPFSSACKWSLVYSRETGSLVLGAPDILLGDGYNDVLSKVSESAGAGKRVLLFAVSEYIPEGINEENIKSLDLSQLHPPKDIEPAALIIIEEQIRPQAQQTFQYFEKEGVDIKVISGDNPITVSQIAAKAGLKDADKWIDASKLDNESLKEAVFKHTVFGRVSPEQKLQIVKILQDNGAVVAMTGDGANDVMALREADCGIAMQSGSDAAKCAADIVLTTSDFSALPVVVAEGRKSINNLQRSAGLYLTKTVYSFILAIFFVFCGYLTYPFENIQVTLIGAVTIGIPSFFLAFESNTDRVKGSFLKNVFRNAVPAGFLEAAALLGLSFYLKVHLQAGQAQISAASTYLMILTGLIVILHIQGKLNVWKTVMILCLAGISIAAAVILPGLFSLVEIDPLIFKAVFIAAGIFAAVYFAVIKIIIPSAESKLMK